MNGKVSRALRHALSGEINIRDVGILSRRMTAESARLDMRPKFKAQRVRTPAPLHSPTWPANEQQFNQSRPIIVQRPMRLILKRIEVEYTSFKTLTKGLVDTWQKAGRLPKHLLDRMAITA